MIFRSWSLAARRALLGSVRCVPSGKMMVGMERLPELMSRTLWAAAGLVSISMYV